MMSIRQFSTFLLRNPISAASRLRQFSSNPDIVNFKFVEEKNPNVQILVNGEVGTRVLDVAIRHNVDIEGACGGELACSTCHVVLSKELYDKLPKKTEQEQDMLDLAVDLQPT